jgi:hypothetical protein
MPVIRIPAALKYYVDNHSEMDLPAASVTEALAALAGRYPSVKFHRLRQRRPHPRTGWPRYENQSRRQDHPARLSRWRMNRVALIFALTIMTNFVEL